MQAMQWRHGAMRLGMVFSLLLLEALPAAAAAGQVLAPGAGNHMLVLTASRRRSNKAPCKNSERVHPNGETYSQRERRLMRECRGLPNAGACRGYGQ